MTDFRTLLLALGASLLGVGTVVAQTTTPSADGRSDEVALRPAGITGSLATDPAGIPDTLAAPADADKLVFVEQPKKTRAGETLNPVTVQLKTWWGRDVAESGVPVTLSISSGSGTLSGTTTRETDNSGLATFDDLSIDLIGSKKLQASSGSLAPATSKSFDIILGNPAALRIVREPSETATAGEPFERQPELWVVDKGGNLIESDNSTVVTASRLEGSGDLQGPVEVTARKGVVSFSNLSHNVANEITIRFTGGSLTEAVSAPVDVRPASAARLVFLQQPTSTPAGAIISPAVTVGLKDAFGNDVADGGKSVRLTLASGSGTLSGTLTRNTADGIATFDDVSINLTGSKTLAASSGDLTGVDSNPFTISAQEPAAVTFTEQPSNSEAGAPIAPPVTVQLRDRLNNKVPLAGVNVTVELGSGTGTLKGTATGQTDGQGLATFDDLSIDQAGEKRLRATSGGLTPDLSSAFTISAGRESRLAFVQQPTNTVAGEEINPAVTVQLRDSFDNEVAKPGVSVRVYLAEPSTGTLSGTTTQLTDESGLATFSNLSVDLIGVKTLTASATGLTSVESMSFGVSSASPSKVVFIESPSGATAGVPFPTQPVVQLQDQHGNPVTGVAEDVTLAIQTNAGGDGVLGGSTTVSVDTATGNGTFTGLWIDKAGDGYTLTATGSTVSTIPGTVLSNPFAVVAALPSQVRVETDTGGTGTLLGTQTVSSGTSITVYAIARDEFNNFVSNVAATAWMLLDRTGGVEPTDLVPSSDGRSATFTGGAVGSAVINAVALGLSSVPSGTITVVNNATATQILVETAANGTGTVVQDQNLRSGNSLTVYAIARDLNDNYVANVAAEGWSLLDLTGGVEPGDLVPLPDARSAVFTGGLLGTARIQATLHSLEAKPTGRITVTPGLPAAVSVMDGTPQATKVGTAFATRLAARVTDAAGNPTRAVPVSFDAPSAGPSGEFEGGVNIVVTDSAGIAIAPVFVANLVAGTYTVTASVANVPTVASFVLTNSAQDVGRITAVQGTPQTAQVGTAFPVLFAASVQDSYGNPVARAEVTFSAPATGPSGTFPGSALGVTVTTGDSGIATAPEFSANLTSGTYVVTATAPNLAGPAQFVLTNAAGSAASITAVSGSQQAAEVTTSFAIPLQVLVEDASGNPASGVMVTFVAPAQGPSGEFQWGGTINVATDTNGIATAPSFRANTVAGSYDVEASASGVPTTATFGLTNLPATVASFLIDAVEGGPVGPQTVRIPFDIRIRAQDRFGNLAAGFAGTVDLTSSGALTEGAGITPSFAGGVLARRTVAVKNAGRVVLVALRTGGAEMGQSDTFQVNNPVPQVSDLSPTSGARGESLTLTVRGSGFLEGVTSVLMGNNITTYESVASDSQITVQLNIGPNALEGPRTVLVINPPPGGGITNIEGGFTVEGISYPTTYSLQNTIVFPSHTQNSEYRGADYRIIGLPGAGDNPIGQFLSGSPNQDWMVYWDNGDTANYLVPYDGTNTFQLAPGRAFWLLHRGPLVIDATVPTAPMDSSARITVPLHSGWNLISNPFAFPVAWTDIQAENDSDALGGVYAFDGSFSVATVLNPFEGVLLDNAGNIPSLVIPFREARLFKPDTPVEGSWRVEIGLTVDDYSEQLVSFGISPGARIGRDAYDWRHPRGVGSLPELAFSHPDWGPESGLFATDIRPEHGAMQVWTMELRSEPGDPVQLSFEGLPSIPGHGRVVLINDERARVADLRAEPVYAFTPVTPVTHLRIAVGSDVEVQGLIEGAIPREFALENNYPNPFNPSTAIPVTVPTASAVTLRVYTILGELVRTVHEGPLEAGRHVFEWDGTSGRGQPVSAGVYLVRLMTEGGRSFVRKMLLIK